MKRRKKKTPKPAEPQVEIPAEIAHTTLEAETEQAENIIEPESDQEQQEEELPAPIPEAIEIEEMVPSIPILEDPVERNVLLEGPQVENKAQETPESIDVSETQQTAKQQARPEVEQVQQVQQIPEVRPQGQTEIEQELDRELTPFYRDGTLIGRHMS